MADIVNDFYRGDTPSFKFQVYDDSDMDSSPDITGWTFYFTAKAKRKDVDASAVIGPASVVASGTDATNGLATLTLTESDTAVDPDAYFYDVQVKDDGNLVETIESGTFRVLQDITITTA